MEKVQTSKPQNTTAFGLFLLLCCTIVLTNSTPTPGNLPAKMPAMAEKAGGKFRPELLTPPANEAELVKQVTAPQEEEAEYYDYEEEGANENNCDEGMYWHNRGGQCVPERCPYGRNAETGLCKEPEPEPLYRGFYGYHGYRPGRRGSRWWNRRRGGGRFRG